MKIRHLILGAAAFIPGIVSSLFAQEATVGAVGWFSSDGIPGQPPQAKRRLRVDYPDEMRKAGDPGYAIIFRHLDADGQSLSLSVRATQRPFQRSVEEAMNDWTMRSATNAGKPVAAQFWIPVIFNPVSASPDRPDATPRLLAVAPVIVQTKPPDGGAPVWAKVSLDAAGAPVSFDLESPENEVLRDAIETALKRWRFAPARQAGKPAPATLRVAFLVYPEMAPVPSKRTPPRVLRQQKPVYPWELAATGLKGEVQIRFVVDRTGRVVDPVVESSNSPAFNEPAIAAVLKWKFAPAMVDGRAVNARMTVPIIFEPEIGGREAYSVKPPSRRARERLPEALRFDTPPKPRGAVIPVYPVFSVEGRRGRKGVRRICGRYRRPRVRDEGDCGVAAGIRVGADCRSVDVPV